MSIPDNPFQSTSPPTLVVDNISPTGSSPPILSASRHASPPTEGQSANHTPGGSLLLPSGGHTGSGTATGAKTPRRVQWNNDSHIVTISPAPASPTNQLDENNINVVTAALERHRSRTSARAPRPQSTLSIASSVGTSATGTDEDYDYRLDVDPEPGLHPVASNGSERFTTDRDRLREILGDDVNDRITGEMIPLGETDGLPNISSVPDKEQDLKDAKSLVRAHTGKWGVLRRRVRGAHAVSSAFGPRSSRTDAAATDAEKISRQQSREFDDFANRYSERRPSAAAPGMPGMPTGGASVLSSLLALYGQQQGLESGTTSAASSRPSSPGGYSSEADEDRRRDSAFTRTRRSSNDSSPSMSTPADGYITDRRRPSQVIDLNGDNVLTHHQTKSEADLSMDRPSKHPGIKDQFRRLTDRALRDADRPRAARSGAGVFGALIQNTNNLAGAAAPAASVLAPAANRPGYQLSRYSLPAPNAPDLTSPWRPSSRTGSRPGSVHSSTAVSHNDDSRDDTPFSFKKAVSSDDLASLKEKEKDFRAKKPKSLRLDTLGTAFKDTGYAIKSAEKWVMSAGKTPLRTPEEKAAGGDYFARPLTEDERRRKEWEREKKRRKKAKEARKKQEVFIIQHVAAILARQQFLLKLARALMMFGSPSHRLETQIQATARVLELNAQVVYMPGTMLVSFSDDATHTSETKFLKQATGLDLGKLLATHNLYWNVVHDKMSVEDASKDLDILMTTPVYYNWWQTLIIGAMCSAFITVIGFSGSFIDALMAMPLGSLLCGVQMLAARNDMFSNVFEIVIATIISFVAAALASTQVFCYTALVSGGVVLILPGYIVLSGALELASRNITAGAVRIGYSVIYSLFLGFGISIGAELYHTMTGLTVVGPDDYQCVSTHSGKAWYQSTPSAWWYFLCCPGYSLFLALRNQQPLFARELLVMVLISCAGWSSNHYSALAFPNRSDLTSAIGSFVVGTLGNVYGRLSNGNSFPVTVPGILFQLPSGLSNGGIFSFASETTQGTGNAYSDGFQVAEQLVSVAIGLTVGLFISAAVTHPFGGGRKRGSGIFSF